MVCTMAATCTQKAVVLPSSKCPNPRGHCFHAYVLCFLAPPEASLCGMLDSLLSLFLRPSTPLHTQ